MTRFAGLVRFTMCVGAVLHGPLLLADDYPVKPVRLIVPGPPGGAVDVRGRWLADKLTSSLGRPVVVDNRAGAGGNIGTEAAAKSAPDGYTLLIVHQGTLAINPHLYQRLGYDPFADFAPLTTVSVNPLLLAVHPDVPAQSVAELVKLAKEKRGQLNYGSPGNGTPPHLAGELFRLMAGIQVTHVPYKGGAAALADLVAGRIAYSMDSPSVQLPQVKAGRIRALALTGRERVGSLPAIPTVAESGLPGYEYLAWTGVAAPAATPKAIITKLHAEIAKAIRSAEGREWLAASGAEPGGEPPEQFAAFIKAEYEKWGRVVRDAGIKAE